MFVYTKEIVKQLIEEAVSKEGVSYRGILRPIEEMSHSQKRKMSSLFTHPCNFEDAIFFCDKSMFNAGKKGFVITKDAVYFTKGFMGILDSSAEERNQTLAYYGISRMEKRFDGAEHYIYFEFINSARRSYTFNRMEDFFAAILSPLVEARLEAERKEREEKYRIEKEQRKKEAEKIRLEMEEAKRIAEENRLERERQSKELVAFQIRKLPMEEITYIAAFVGVVEYDKSMYFLAGSAFEPDEVQVFRLIHISENIGDFEYRRVEGATAEEIKKCYYERQK